ncbi:hypothetical protein EON62_02915 [archaeon]|nr:MAG: hypothetical protein EON62_02915 [archaeon]
MVWDGQQTNISLCFMKTALGQCMSHAAAARLRAASTLHPARVARRPCRYNVLGDTQLRTFNLCPPGSNERVARVSMCASGMAAITQSLDMQHVCYAIYSWDDLKVTVCPDLGISAHREPTALATIDACFAESEAMEILLTAEDSGIVLIESNGLATMHNAGQQLQGTAHMMAISPDAMYLAAVCQIGIDFHLTILTTTFSEVRLSVPTNAPLLPSQIAWCGDEVVVMAWLDQGLMAVSLNGMSELIPYSLPMFIAQVRSCLVVQHAPQLERPHTRVYFMHALPTRSRAVRAGNGWRAHLHCGDAPVLGTRGHEPKKY